MRGKNYNAHNWTTARFAGVASCGHRLMVGDVITFRPMDAYTQCNDCAHKRAKELREARLLADQRSPVIPGLLP